MEMLPAVFLHAHSQRILVANGKFSFSGLKILTDIHSSNTFTQPEWRKGKKGKKSQDEILKFPLGWKGSSQVYFWSIFMPSYTF